MLVESAIAAVTTLSLIMVVEHLTDSCIYTIVIAMPTVDFHIFIFQFCLEVS